MTDRANNPPRGTPGHQYAFTKPGDDPHIGPPDDPQPPGTYYPDASDQVAHPSPGNARTVYPSPYSGPGVLMADPTPPGGIPEAPADGKQYGRQNEDWTEIIPPLPPPLGVPEAPGDGNQYARKDGAWSAVAFNKLPNGTVAAPGLAFASEPGLGWYRSAAASMRWAAGAADMMALLGGATNSTNLIVTPRAPGVATFELRNQTTGVADFNKLAFLQDSLGGAFISTGIGGTATRGNLTLDAPQVQFPAGTVAAPGISFASEPGLGWYRHSAGLIATAAGGILTSYLDAAAPTATALGLSPRAADGSSTLNLRNQPNGVANANYLDIKQNANGSASITTYGNARGNLILDAPFVSIGPGVPWVSTPNPTFSSFGLSKLAGGSNNLSGSLNGVLRWIVRIGNATAETGSNTGSDFEIQRMNDAGVAVSSPFSINRATGNVTAQGLTTLADTDALRAVVTDLGDKLKAALARIAALEKHRPPKGTS